MCGIAINDSILKVDTINRLLESGYGLKHAILEAGKRRLNAIIMTSLTTILAIAPFLVRGDMGSDLQYPLSLALISGMVAGTLVSIFFVPLAYYEIYKKRYR
jgi:multidrug efflux pump subunit AcrB